MSDQKDPGSGWFGGNQGSRGGPSRSVRLIATAVAAFVTVLGLVLFLHLYICYVRRRNRRRSAADADDLPSAFNMTATTGDADPAAAKPGLEPSAIAALPSVAYCKVREPSCSECAICLAAMREGDAVRVLPPCGHVFHLGCVDKWLASSSSCPVCRAVVAPPTAAMWAHEKFEVEAAAGGGSAPARLGASLWRMVSRERPSGRRLHAVQAVQDLERQQQHPTMQ